MASIALHVQSVLPAIKTPPSCQRTFASPSLVRTSLPPLPAYPLIERRRPRWGEDVAMETAGFDVMSSGYARLRNNYDNCHPVRDVTTTKYDGYMFPKPLYQDLGYVKSICYYRLLTANGRVKVNLTGSSS